MEIKQILARQILDSRGNPTVEADVVLGNGALGRASVPSGASTGSREAVEFRDGGSAYGGKGVTKAIGHIYTVIAPVLIGKNATSQAELDKILCELDGTPNKAHLGANAMLAVSLATAKAAALAASKPLYAYVGGLINNEQFSLPMPMINIINGGKHAAGSTDIQEFMIVPVSAENFAESVQWGAEVFHMLGELLAKRGYTTTVGDEGGYAPAVRSGNREAMQLIVDAITGAGYEPGRDIALALDVAASELYAGGKYVLRTEGKQLSSHEMLAWYKELIAAFPLVSIEDGLDENDWEGWQSMTADIGHNLQLVGDDLLVTNTEFLRRAINTKAATAILIKPNQIGTLTETVEAVKMAHAAGWRTIISHRSGETEDTTIAHLAVGLNTSYIKTGSLSRGERTAKYNELLRIEEQLKRS